MSMEELPRKRIEDPATAEAMARASDKERTEATQWRESAERYRNDQEHSPEWREDKVGISEAGAGNADLRAEIKEEKVAYKIEAENLTDDELKKQITTINEKIKQMDQNIPPLSDPKARFKMDELLLLKHKFLTFYDEYYYGRQRK